jgi:hypothetical protein
MFCVCASQSFSVVIASFMSRVMSGLACVVSRVTRALVIQRFANSSRRKRNIYILFLSYFMLCLLIILLGFFLLLA